MTWGRAFQVTGLMMILVMLALVPATAQDEDPGAAMASAYTSLLEQVEVGEWQAVWTAAKALAAAGDGLALDAMTADQVYMLGVAHYYMMGIAMDTAVSAEGLSADRLAFAEKTADMVFGRGEAEAIQIIAFGEEVDLAEYVVEGKKTVVDFFSKFCPPCLAIGPVLENLVNQRPDLALVKVDINRPGVQGIDWQSPVAQQFSLRSIPHFQIYDEEGTLIAEGQAAGQMLMKWSQEVE